MPNYWLIGLALIIVGVSAQTFTTNVNSTVQLSTEPVLRGRVVAILLAIALGGTPIDAPIVGSVADTFGPRWALGVGAASGFAAAIVGIHYLTKYRHLRVRQPNRQTCASIMPTVLAALGVLPARNGSPRDLQSRCEVSCGR